MTTDRHEVTYRRHPADVHRWYLHSFRQRLPAFVARTLLAALCWWGLRELAHRMIAAYAPPGVRDAGVLVDLGLLLGYGLWLWRRVDDLRAGAEAKDEGEWHMAVEAQGLTVTAGVGSTCWPWSEVRAVETSSDGMYFLFPDGAYIVPRLAFATPAEADAFVHAARHHLREARQPAAPATATA